MKNISIGIFALFVVVACATNNRISTNSNEPNKSKNNSTTNVIQTDTTKRAKVRPVYRAAETILTDLIHTKLEVDFDWKLARMNGLATITAKQHFYPSDSLILDAKGMDIHYVKMGKKELKFSYDSLVLKIQLDKVYANTERFTVEIKYVAKPNERNTSGSQAITSDKGLYFINPNGTDKGKMPQIWTQGETEASSVWFPTIDAPNAKTTQEIFIRVENKYTTLSNGKLLGTTFHKDGTRTDHWKQDLAHAPYLFMMGVGEFKVVKDFYTRQNGEKMEVNYLVEPEWEKYAKAIFGETPNMIGFFSKLLGLEYPWDKYHQIVVRDYVSGAMENTGAVVFGDYAYKTDRELLDGNDQSTIAHELFHHWFGDLVTCESWSNLSLNESFANYSQYLWDEHRYGVDEADFQADVEAEGYFQSAKAQGYHDLIWFTYDDKEQMFDGHSYNKGGRILHMLRNHLGDEAFFAGMKKYLYDNQFKAAEFHHLRLAFEEVSGQDLNWFFNQWYLAAGHPVLDVVHTQNTAANSVSVAVKQIQNLDLSPIYKLPVQIAVFDSNGKQVHRVVIDSLNQKFEFKYTGTLKGVVFDYQQMLLSKTRETKPNEQYIFQYYNGERYKARRDGLIFGSKVNGVAANQLILDALNDPFWNIRVLAIERCAKLDGETKQLAMRLVTDLAKSDPNSTVRVAALNMLQKLLNETELSEVNTNRIQHDLSYNVVTTALKNLAKSNPQQAILLAEKLENESSSKMQAGIAQLYGAYGNMSKFTYFEKVLTADLAKGIDQLTVLNGLTFFLVRQEVELVEQSVALYELMQKNGGYYTKMFLPQNCNFLREHCLKKIAEMDVDIEKHTKNKDVLYADQARKKRKQWEALLLKFETINGTE
jgi:aminopeptidase N